MKKIVRLRTFLLLALLGLSRYSMAQPLVKAEYFFDSDPGVGKGTALAISSTYGLNLNTSISLPSLSVGPHQVFIRVLQDSSNATSWWSLAESRWFNVVNAPTFPNYKIAAAEYFFDSDPGVGKGTPFTTGTVDSTIISTTISTSSLGTGSHNLFWRFKNTNNVWGNFDSRSFVVFNINPVISKKLVYGEYFIDTDPGFGKGTSIAFGTADSLKTNFTANLNGITKGVHEITFRMKDSIGKWTLAESRFFNVLPPPDKTYPITSVEFFYDTDPGVGKGFVFQTVANKDSINITSPALANGLTNGTHIAMMRVRDSIGRYSLVDAKSFYVCSVFPITNFKADFISFDSTVNFTNQTTGSDSNTKYYWDFNGDGVNDNSFQNPDYKYINPGVYKVRLIATNGGVCADTVFKKVVASSDTCKLTSGFIYLAKVTNEVDFQDQSAGSVGAYYWNFGDGSTSTQKNPIHKFALAGNYEVSLAIKNGTNSCTDFSSQVIKVGTSGCQASFTDLVDTSKKAKFTNTSFGSGLRYFWYFGDGSYSIDTAPSHKFANNGLYKVTLTISKPDGTCSSEFDSYVTVGKVKCSASFTYYVDSLSNMAYFSNQIIGPSTNLFWNFGDSKSSTANNPLHPYANPGYYTVGLNTFNASDYCMDYYEQTILVGQANTDCQADFVYTADTTKATVSFFDASKGDIIGYIWNFGDVPTTYKAEKNPIMTYVPAGYKNVCLTVVNSLGRTSYKCKSIYSGSYALNDCRAAFTYTIDSATNHAYYNDLSAGLSKTNSQNAWKWDLGNGIKATTQNGDVSYASNGYYIVSLGVVNNITGCVSKTVKVVGVGTNQKPVKSGFGYKSNGSNTKTDGYPVDFEGAGVGDHARLRWSFGDSTGGKPNTDTTTLTPTHTFSNIGNYQVCLTIKNQISGDSDVYCQQVTVTSSTLCVHDVTPPTVYCKNISIKLDATGKKSILASDVDSLSFDNCSSTTLSLDKQAFTIADVGNNVVKLSVKDSSNNVTTCFAIVHVQSSTEVNSQTLTDNFSVWPNPMNGYTNIHYALKQSSLVEISVYDIQGKAIENIVNAKKDAGEYTFTWDGSGLTKGTYIITIKASEGNGRKILIKQ